MKAEKQPPYKKEGGLKSYGHRDMAGMSEEEIGEWLEQIPVDNEEREEMRRELAESPDTEDEREIDKRENEG